MQWLGSLHPMRRIPGQVLSSRVLVRLWDGCLLDAAISFAVTPLFSCSCDRCAAGQQRRDDCHRRWHQLHRTLCGALERCTLAPAHSVTVQQTSLSGGTHARSHFAMPTALQVMTQALGTLKAGDITFDPELPADKLQAIEDRVRGAKGS